MKKTILFTALMAVISFASIAQTRAKPPRTDTSKYDYFVKIPLADFKQIWPIVVNYKDVQMHDPSTTDSEKTKMFTGLASYTKQLSDKLKVDSVLKKK